MPARPERHRVRTVDAHMQVDFTNRYLPFYFTWTWFWPRFCPRGLDGVGAAIGWNRRRDSEMAPRTSRFRFVFRPLIKDDDAGCLPNPMDSRSSLAAEEHYISMKGTEVPIHKVFVASGGLVY